jgi:outer membrane protein assembly factor BamB
MKTFLKIACVSAVSIVLLSACASGEPAPSSFPGLLVDGSSAYLASNQHVHKFDPETGIEAWRYPAVGQIFERGAAQGPFAGEPLRFKEWVIVGGAIARDGVPDAHVYALQEGTGQIAWRWSVPGQSQQDRREFADGVATDGTLLFAANGNGTLYALDPSTLENNQPKLVWSFPTGNKLWSRPVTADGKVFQSSLDHTLYALDAKTGKELWRFKANAAIASTPAYADATLYVGAFDGNFYAIDAATGAKRWESKVDAWIWNRAAVAKGVVFFGDTKGRFYALNAGTGKRNFVADLGDTIHGAPVVIGDNVYAVASNTFAYVMPVAGQGDASGVLAPSRLSDAGYLRRLLSAPAAYEGKLLLPLFDGDVKLTAIRLNDRAKAYDVTLPTATPPPAK